MHGAPSVKYPVGRSYLAAGILLAAWALGATACAWWSWSGASGWRTGLALSTVLVTGGIAAHWWARQPEGLLGWDGTAWTWDDGGSEADCGMVEVGLDLQWLLLLRWGGADRRRWFWLEGSRMPGRWAALRRAVYSRADPAALPGAEPPSART
jgi:hypothetical protein